MNVSSLSRSTPCPQVKTGDEWGDPANCDAGDNCQYCHTRTEQQFHPEIYKSTKCNDIQNTSYCPRGAFCAFAHVERKVFFLTITLGEDPTRFNLVRSLRAVTALITKWREKGGNRSSCARTHSLTNALAVKE